ncbi:MAG: MmgE/PrpD family protein, partial [Thermomicrobium sp.]|nr:MmgE/PrpD family protein [Thermomicrobium sp.]
GTDWRFPLESTIKPYPHCRVPHGLFDVLRELQQEHDIRPEEITEIRAWGEAWVEDLPVWMNKRIEDVTDAQFSVPHGLAVAAQRIAPGPAWQDPEVVFSDEVLGLMERVKFKGHPSYVSALEGNRSSRPARVEIDARGTTFSGERLYPKGSPSPDSSSLMSTEEVLEKFLVNAVVRLPEKRAREVAEAILALEDAGDVSGVISMFAAQGKCDR